LPAKPVDPFLTGHKKTQILQKEEVRCEGVPIVVVPYILPHSSKLKPNHAGQAGAAESGLRKGQGLYIYRNKRLIIWGTWFRMAPQEELTKLARVRVDIPNSLDHLWTLDIKKSAAYPPDVVRVVMKRILERITGTSRRVFSFRGRQTNKDVDYAWVRLKTREGYAYSINGEHPLIDGLRSRLDPPATRHLDEVLRLLEQSFPTQALYNDMAGDVRIEPPETDLDTRQGLEQMGRLILEVSGGPESERGQDFLARLGEIEPFSNHDRATLDAIREAIRLGF